MQSGCICGSGFVGNCPSHGYLGTARLGVVAEPQPNEGVVALLRSALADAEAGKMRGFVMVGLYRGDETFTYNAGELVPHRALGAIEMMKFKILKDRIEW